MGLGRKLAVGTAGLAALGAGGIYHTARWMETTDQVPEVLGRSITPVDELPSFLPLNNKEGLICDQDPNNCKKTKALGVLNAKYQIPIPLAQMGSIPEVVIPIEDRTFYQNNGISGRGVARAILSTMRGNRQGGSTATSQTAKMLFAPASEETLKQEGVEDALRKLDDSWPRELLRKIPYKDKLIPKYGVQLAKLDDKEKSRALIRDAALQYHEFRLAMKLKEVYSDEQILEMYLNNIPLGRNTHGVEAASLAMYGKHTKDLDVPQAAMLVAQMTGPSNKDLSFDAYTDTDPDKVTDPKKREELIELKQERSQEMANLKARYIRIINSLEEQGKITGLTIKTPQGERLITDEEISKLSPVEHARMMSEKAEEYRNIDLYKYLIPYNPRLEVDMKNAAAIGGEHVVQMARSQALEILKGITNNPNMEKKDLAGYTIRLNIDNRAQAALTKAIREDPKLRTNNLEAAGVILDSQGHIIALTGSTDYKKTQVNMAIGQEGGGTGRPAGSGLKGLAAVFAIEHSNITVDTRLPHGHEVPVSAPKKYKEPNGKITRYDDAIIKPSHSCKLPEGGCTASVREIVARSMNEGAAQLVQNTSDDKTTGIEKFKSYLNEIGIPVAQPFPSVILGGQTGEAYTPLQLATGHSVLINDGRTVEHQLIAEILDSENKVVYKAPPPSNKQVLREDSVDGGLDAMSATVRETYGTAHGTFDLVRGPFSVAGKTGTANKITDTWFNFVFCGKKTNVSYPASQYAASIWTGHAEGQKAQTNKKTAMSSKDVAHIGGRAVSQMIQSSEPCDVRD